MAGAQTSDPVVMTINGQKVTRSEFEYSYNKNNGDDVIEKTTVEQYLPLFVNYKLKVVAALDAKLDTLTSFRKEFAKYRDQQVRPLMVTSEDVENEARKIYDDRKQMIGDKGLCDFRCRNNLPEYFDLRYRKKTDRYNHGSS